MRSALNRTLTLRYVRVNKMINCLVTIDDRCLASRRRLKGDTEREAKAICSRAEVARKIQS